MLTGGQGAFGVMLGAFDRRGGRLVQKWPLLAIMWLNDNTTDQRRPQMNSTTSLSIRGNLDASVFDVTSLLSRLSTLTDSRSTKGLRYPLAPALLLIVLAKLSGEDQPCSIADWIENRGNLLGEAFHLSWSRMPHHNTVRRIVEDVVMPEELDCVVSEHLRSLPGVGHSILISINGIITNDKFCLSRHCQLKPKLKPTHWRSSCPFVNRTSCGGANEAATAQELAGATPASTEGRRTASLGPGLPVVARVGALPDKCDEGGRK